MTTNITTVPEPTIVSTSFNKNGFHYTQVWRDENYAIYKQGGCAWELVRIRRHKKDINWGGGKVTPAGSEYLPNDNEWGSHGWTLHTKERAFEKLQEVVARDKRRAKSKD